MNRRRVTVILVLMALVLGTAYWLRLRSAQRRDTAQTEAAAGIPSDATAPKSAGVTPTEAELKESLQSANERIVRLEGQVATLMRRLDELAQRPSSTARGPRDNAAAEPEQPKRAWGAEQAAGPPDTFQAGDIQTAWAPRTPDGGEEWLKLDFARAVPIANVRVRETFNPGAVIRVAAAFDDGQEITLWQGDEPPSTAPADVDYPAATNLIARSVKVYLDTARVSGWNEIDAVELIGTDGSRQWASHASASSSFADQRGGLNWGLQRLGGELSTERAVEVDALLREALIQPAAPEP